VAVQVKGRLAMLLPRVKTSKRIRLNGGEDPKHVDILGTRKLYLMGNVAAYNQQHVLYAVAYSLQCPK